MLFRNSTNNVREKVMDARRSVGVYWALSISPIWVIAMFLYGMSSVIYVARDIFEGMPYQVAYSAQIGDAALFCVVLLAAGILQRGIVRIPYVLRWQTTQVGIFVASFCLGAVACITTLASRSGQGADIYHDLWVAPLIMYFAATLLPIIFLNGTRVEKVATVCSIFLWAGLVFYDIDHNRINQRQWLVDHVSHIEWLQKK